MLKKNLLIFLMFILIFSMNGCMKDIKTPSDTMKSPQYSNKDEIFNEYKKFLRENNDPEDLLTFLEKNIDKLTEENADVAVTRIIELQESLLPIYKGKALEKSEDLAGLGTDKEFHDLLRETQKLVKDALNNGYKVSPQADVKIDYEKINEITRNSLSDELKDYIKIESDDYIDLYNPNINEKEYLYSEKEYLDLLQDDKLDEYLNELAKRINQTYIYIDKHKNSPYLLRIKELKKMYLDIYLFGSPNKPSFVYYKGYKIVDTNGKIQKNYIHEKWKENYIHLENDSQKWENTLKNNDDKIFSKQFAVDMTSYVNILTANSFMLNAETNEIISGIINQNIN